MTDAPSQPGTDLAVQPDIAVPDGETPAGICGHCGRPFRRERALALHLGSVHEGDLDATEAAAFEKAQELEHDDLFYFHAKVVGALGIIYSVTVIAYMVAFGTGLL